MIIGYARVSTDDQKLDLQVQALKENGCDRIFTDHGQSGYRFDRCGLEKAMQALKPGATLVVWRLDRLGRSLVGLVDLLERLEAGNVHFRSLSENIDTASSGGKLIFHVMAALAEFERSLISERTRAGMAAAKAKGTKIGRPQILSLEQIHIAKGEIKKKKATQEDIAGRLNISTRTLRRYITSAARRQA
ncbi:recombinase family protein [Brucella gallinifaecis]|uniref:Recombinase family protein n=1 Tax=Brucella gallinifaecis TaxID=215590 RepID=A0A502BL50_9HYPH|nr:recombinase family protein [Brucella gallinifaecis]TPF74389.1 recombinase family protein [Brucella gallinifaecis]